MANFHESGNLKVPVIDGPERKLYPFEGDRASIIIEQDYQQKYLYWERLQFSTLYPNARNWFLVDETNPVPLGGGIVKWTRVYAAIPQARDEFETYTYEYPGYYYGYSSLGNTEGRDPVTFTVVSRLRYEYFLVGAQYQRNPRNVPQIKAYGFYGIGGISFPVRLLADLSSPTKDQYINLVKSRAEIVAEDSVLRRWKGDIYERVTRYIVAK